MKALTFLLSVAVLAAIVSCSKDTPANISGDDSLEMPASVQGLFTKYSVPVEIPTSDDELVQHPQAPAEPPYRNYDVYAVTILWGSLTNLSAGGGQPVDWSGTLGINGVATIDILHTIQFESGQDSLIATNSPATAAWVSQTSGDFDGINCLIYVDRDIVYITAPMLTLTTPLLTKSFYLGDLENLDAYYPVNNTAALAIHARKLYGSECPNGSLSGEWVRNDVSGQAGSFEVAWVDAGGNTFGILAGTFWSGAGGVRIFEGWVSQGMTTMVVYHVYGTWSYDDPRMCPICGSSRGVFAGFYTDINGNLKGFVRGQFGSVALDPSVNELPLSGYWREYCNDVSFPTARWFR